MPSLIHLPELVTLSLTARHGFVAPPGWCIASIDYSSQELYIAAVESNDQVMLNSFRPNDQVADYIPVLGPDGGMLTKDGKPVMAKNPAKDLHTITAQSCTHPELFIGREAYEWCSLSRDPSLINVEGCARDFGKRL